MAIAIQCPRCQAQYNVDDKLAGKKVKCKGCTSPISVPLDGAEVLELESPDTGFGADLAPPPAPPPPSPLQNAVASGRTNSGRRAPVTRCPSCTGIVADGSVVCTLCGYNFQTGSKEPAANFLDEPAGGEDAPATKRWFRKRGNPMLESLDEMLKLGIILFTIAAIGVWVWHLYKTQGALTVFTFLPLAVALGLLLGVVAPATAAAINAAVKILRYIPRNDTYTRVAMALMLPFAGSLAAGFPGMEKSLDFLVPLTWFGGVGLMLYFLRAELIEWLISGATALAAVTVVWLLLAGIISSVGLAAPLYAEMLPGKPWTSFTTGHMPAPVIKPAGPAVATGDPAPAGTTKPAVAETPPPSAVNPTPAVATGNPTPPPPPTPAPTGAVIPAPPPGPTVQANAVTEQPKVASPLLASVTPDVQALKGINDILTPAMTSTHFLVTRHENDDTTTVVECWSASPLEKKGATAFPYFSKKPASYAVAPRGDGLVALSFFPRSQLEFISLDGKTAKKTIELNEPTATPTLLGYVNPGQVAIRWDRGFESRVQIWNTLTGISVPRGLTLEPVSPTGPTAVSPNGRLYAVLGRDRYLHIYDLQMSQVIRRIAPSNLTFTPVQLAFSPDSTQIAFYGVIEETPTVICFRVQNGEQVSSAVLPSPPPAGRGGEGTDPTSFLWLQSPAAWLVNGTDLLDPASGRRFGSIESTGILARKPVGAGQVLFLAGDGETKTVNTIVGKFDEAKVKSAMDRLR